MNTPRDMPEPDQDLERILSFAGIIDGPPEALSEQVDAIVYECGSMEHEPAIARFVRRLKQTVRKSRADLVRRLKRDG